MIHEFVDFRLYFTDKSFFWAFFYRYSNRNCFLILNLFSISNINFFLFIRIIILSKWLYIYFFMFVYFASYLFRFQTMYTAHQQNRQTTRWCKMFLCTREYICTYNTPVSQEALTSFDLLLLVSPLLRLGPFISRTLFSSARVHLAFYVQR